MSRRRSAGFTLVEMMVALAITGLIIIALNTFVFSMGELWGRNTDYRIFHEHVQAVANFLEEQLKTATLPPSARASSTPIMPIQVTTQEGVTDNLITFDLPAGCRILSWPDRPLPEVTCSLQVRPGQGLYLLWQSRLETQYGTQPPREMLLTPFCTSMAYDYYDDNFKRWTTYTVLQTDSSAQPELPQRLRLTFAYGKIPPFTVTIPIPTAIQGVPNY